MFVLCHMSPQFWSSDPAVQSPDILHPWGRLQDEEFSIRGPCKFRRLSHWQDRTTLLLLTVLVRVMAGSRSICCASYPRSGNHDNAIRLAKLRFKTVSKAGRLSVTAAQHSRDLEPKLRESGTTPLDVTVESLISRYVFVETIILITHPID